MKQLSIEEFLEQQEAAEKPYFNGEGMPLPWVEEETNRPADTKLAPLAIDVEKKRDTISLKLNRKSSNETLRGQAEAGLSFFGGENYEIEKRQGVKVKQDSGWRQLKS